MPADSPFPDVPGMPPRKRGAVASNGHGPSNGHTPEPAGPPRGRAAPEPSYVAIRMSDVERRAIRWLWPDKLAYGKLSLLVGDGDLGKSWAMLDLAARLSTGTPLPGHGERGAATATVLLMGEDDAADTIGPRLDAQGADSRRVHLMQGVRRAGATGVVRLQRDLAVVERLLTDKEATLLVVDPLASYIAGTDGINEIDVRGALLPMADLAQRIGVAIVCIMHRNKGEHRNPVNAIGGSVAFGNLARCVLGVAEDPESKGRRCLVPIKGNILRNQSGIGYRITEGILYWDGDPVSLTRETIFAAPTTTGPASGELETGRVADAADVLLTILRAHGGRAPSAVVESEAKQAGFSHATLDRARPKVGIKAQRQTEGDKVVWFMELPNWGSTD